MALIVVKDRTEELTDAIFEGASTKEEARITAKEFQDDIEFEFNNKLREIEAVKQDREDAYELENQCAERKADRQEILILRFVRPRSTITESDNDSDESNQNDDNPAYRRGVFNISFKNQIERMTKRSVHMTHEAEYEIDTDDELRYETDDERFLNEYTVRLDPEFEQYILLQRFESPLSTFRDATRDITEPAEYIEYSDRLLASGTLQLDVRVVKLLRDVVEQFEPRRSKRRRVSSGNK